MHEIGYCEGVLMAVERRAAGRPVARVGVRVGALHRIVPSAFEQSFQLVAAGGIADGAGTEVTVVPATATCDGCGAAFASPDPAPSCPKCGGVNVTVVGGDDLVLEWIQYRDPGMHADAAYDATETGAVPSEPRDPPQPQPQPRPHEHEGEYPVHAQTREVR
jgi:hydrogenase nickel incorporation protein HypA/HybF